MSEKHADRKRLSKDARLRSPLVIMSLFAEFEKSGLKFRGAESYSLYRYRPRQRSHSRAATIYVRKLPCCDQQRFAQLAIDDEMPQVTNCIETHFEN